MTTQQATNPTLANQAAYSAVQNTFHQRQLAEENLKQGSLTERLKSIQFSSSQRVDFIENAACEIAETFNSVFAVLEFEHAGRTIAREFRQPRIAAEQLLEIAELLSVESQLDNSPQHHVIESDGMTYVVMTCPLVQQENKTPFGSLTLYFPIENTGTAEKLLDSFQRTVEWLVEASKNFESPQKPDSSVDASLTAIQKSSKFENLTHLCFGLVNNYCEKLGCEKTAIGLLERDRMRSKLQAVSGLDKFKENSPAIVQINQAQEECLDFGQTIRIQSGEKLDAKSRTRFLIHQQWHQKTAGACVASLPIKNGDKVIGVLSLQRNADQPFTDAELDNVSESITTFAPSIMLMRRAHRGLRQHFYEDYATKLPETVRKSYMGKIAIAMLAFLLLGWLPYKPTVPCTLEPVEMTRLVAPFDGVLASVEFQPGDHVHKGDVILKFDTRQLKLERDNFQALIKSKSVQRDFALMERQTAQASILDAEIESLEAQLASVDRKIERASLKSNIDGHVVRGDLRPNVGQTINIGTALAEIAPLEGMRIKLHIPESKATQVKVGTTGYFAAASQPGDKHPFKIVAITPSTEIVDGKNVMVAEAQVDGKSDWMRSGMKGYAHVNSGWSPVIWILGHNIWNSLRLGFWI